MKRMMKQILMIGALCASIGAGSLHAYKYTIYPEAGAGAWRVRLNFEGDCASVERSKTFLSSSTTSQPITIDSECRLSSMSGSTLEHGYCDQNAHHCIPSFDWTSPRGYDAPAGGDGDGTWRLTSSGITKIK